MSINTCIEDIMSRINKLTTDYVHKQSVLRMNFENALQKLVARRNNEYNKTVNMSVKKPVGKAWTDER